nr:pyruvate, phosphate dikinase, chloroplastic [Tanacetum cinerariifolium]
MAGIKDVRIPGFEDKPKQECGQVCIQDDFEYSQKRHAALLGVTDGLVSVAGECSISQIKINKNNEKQARPNPVFHRVNDAFASALFSFRQFSDQNQYESAHNKSGLKGYRDMIVNHVITSLSKSILLIGDLVIREGEWSSLNGSTGEVMANADTPNDALTARNNGAQGIGLCRTEHMVVRKQKEGDHA